MPMMEKLFMPMMKKRCLHLHCKSPHLSAPPLCKQGFLRGSGLLVKRRSGVWSALDQWRMCTDKADVYTKICSQLSSLFESLLHKGKSNCARDAAAPRIQKQTVASATRPRAKPSWCILQLAVTVDAVGEPWRASYCETLLIFRVADIFLCAAVSPGVQPREAGSRADEGSVEWLMKVL